VPDGEFLTDEIKEKFRQKFIEKFSSQAEENPIEFSFKWVTVAGSPKQKFEQELTKNQIIQADITKNIQEFLSRPDMAEVKIENINIKISENAETKEIEDIAVLARVLYLKNSENIKSEEIKEIEDREGREGREEIDKREKIDDNNKNDKQEENSAPKVTPFSVEDWSKPQNKFIFKSENEITQELVKTLKILPYSNIVLHLDYIPYVTKIIDVDETKESNLKNSDIINNE
jgi:hypothetical protein